MTRRITIHLACLMLVVLSILLTPQTAQAESLYDEVESKIKDMATTEAAQIWHYLGVAYPFNSKAVEIAYAKLTQDRSQADSVATFTLPGMFLHLVKQAVMVNAAINATDLTYSQFFLAVNRGFDNGTFGTLDGMRVKLGELLPDDPNSMAGPVGFTNTHARLLTGTRPLRACSAPTPVVAVTPYTYTINFENVGSGTATQVTVIDKLDSSRQHVELLALSDITWGSTRIYPTSVASKLDGPFTPLVTKALAPTPKAGTVLYYGFSDGHVMKLECAAGGATYTWTFSDSGTTPQWRLAPRQSATISFLIEPIVAPAATNVGNAGARIQFAIPQQPWFGDWMQTNPWLRPNTVF